MAKRYYAAYGSNLNIQQMQWRCPDAKIVGTAIIDGYELLYKGSKTGSYLTIEPSVKNHVPVAIWEVSSKDELALDRYEGYPRFYYKKEMLLPVKNWNTGKTRRRKIFVYIMDEHRPPGTPSRLYVDTCMEGYRDFGFDPKYLQEALERSNKNENRKHEKTLPGLRQRVRRISGPFQKR